MKSFFILFHYFCAFGMTKIVTPSFSTSRDIVNFPFRLKPFSLSCQYLIAEFLLILLSSLSCWKYRTTLKSNPISKNTDRSEWSECELLQNYTLPALSPLHDEKAILLKCRCILRIEWAQTKSRRISLKNDSKAISKTTCLRETRVKRAEVPDY